MRPFRFGVGSTDTDAIVSWPDYCRWVEASGFDVLHASDHLGNTAPFAMLAAAAMVTERLTLGTYVLNVPFWNPALLAREVGTVDRLSGGRIELGLGAGHMKSEFDAAGIPWEGFSARSERLVATVSELDRLFANGGQEPLPAQRPRPRLMIGGIGHRLLRLAAEHADIVAFSGTFQVKGKPPGTLRGATAAELDERVAHFRAAAGERADQVEAGLLLQRVEITDDREAAIAALREQAGVDDPLDDLLTTPVLAYGTVDELVDQLYATRQRYGTTYFVTHRRSAEAFAEVISHVRAREAGPDLRTEDRRP